MTYHEMWRLLMPLYEPSEAKSIARMVFEMRFGLSFTDILCGKDTQISEEEHADLQKIVHKLCNGEPVQYVLGKTEFGNNVLKVSKDTLIPRPETHDLCLWIETHLNRFKTNNLQLLDIGTGSGCIAITLKQMLKHGYVEAWDISPKALIVAKENTERLQTAVKVIEQNALNAPNDTEKWHIIVSNPPYVMQKEQAEMAQHVLKYEPHTALFVPDNNPLLFYNAIAKYAQKALKIGGLLFFEINELLGKETTDMLINLGFENVSLREDRFGKPRMIKATRI